MRKDKNLIDDGFNAELVENAIFDGLLEIPVIKKPKEIIIPEKVIPFTKRKRSSLKNEFIVFYEHDIRFRDVLTSTKEFLDEMKTYRGIVSPDPSLYYNMPLVLQMANVYMNRAVGHFFQKNGLYVIPNVRWGDERSYNSIHPDEIPFAFLGLEKGSIYSIGTYGCCQSAEEKHHIREGLRAMIHYLEPKVIVIYGPMSERIFGEFKSKVTFIHFNDWTSECRKEDK